MEDAGRLITRSLAVVKAVWVWQKHVPRSNLYCQVLLLIQAFVYRQVWPSYWMRTGWQSWPSSTSSSVRSREVYTHCCSSGGITSRYTTHTCSWWPRGDSCHELRKHSQLLLLFSSRRLEGRLWGPQRRTRIWCRSFWTTRTKWTT